jgi:hypothetical protein
MDGLTAVAPTFTELEESLREAVKSGGKDRSKRLLEELRQRFPVPAVDIVPKELWGLDSDQVVFRTHARANIEDAVANVESTGRAVNTEDKEQLRLIMSHWCAWSPTAAEHRNDEWMQFLRRDYRQLEGLQPILDTLIWPDELELYPSGHGPLPAWLFLLATKTTYYVYNLEAAILFKAGEDLIDVVDGLQKERWCEDELWEQVRNMTYEYPRKYFPVYDDISRD